MLGDLYQELGVKKSASVDEIKRAYRKLAAQWHPDRNPGDQKAEARFKAVNRAHQVLSDPAKRKLYDEFGEDGLRDGFDAQAARAYRRSGHAHFRRGVNLEDLFGAARGRGGIGDMFGDLFRGDGRRGSSMKGSDVSSEVTIDFAAALKGAELDVQLREGGKAVKVRVPPGAGDGDKVRVAGQGVSGRLGGATGDLVITIRVKPHPYFERDGLDLFLDLPVTIGEAYFGAKVNVPTPDGDVTLTVPKRAQSGQVVRLRERGVRRKDKRGDLFVRFLVRLPVEGGSKLEKAVRLLDDETDPGIRRGIKF